jgi:hypothetical protein
MMAIAQLYKIKGAMLVVGAIASNSINIFITIYNEQVAQLGIFRQ